MRHHKTRRHTDPILGRIRTTSPTEYEKALRAARRVRKLLDKRWSKGGPFCAGRTED